MNNRFFSAFDINNAVNGGSESDCLSRVVGSAAAPYFCGDWSWNHEIFSTVIIPLPLIQVLWSITNERMCTKYSSLSLSRKKVVSFNDRLNMIIAVDWRVKPQTKQNLVYG